MPNTVLLPMFVRARQRLLAFAVTVAAALAPLQALAQTPPAQTDQPPPTSAPEGGSVYKPPLRGAPGGRVGGASRGAVKSAAVLPMIDLVAPLDHAGQTASATPTLYFFVSGSVALPTQFTISAPLRAAPILEATIASPPARGLYALNLADYRVRLEPGTLYTWSVSIIADAQSWSRNVVASATILRAPLDLTRDNPASTAFPVRRVALLAGSGLWYDAVAAAVAAQNLDRHAVLDELLREAGLADADRALAAGAPLQ
jgi:hypothetical protein